MLCYAIPYHTIPYYTTPKRISLLCKPSLGVLGKSVLHAKKSLRGRLPKDTNNKIVDDAKALDCQLINEKSNDVQEEHIFN